MLSLCLNTQYISYTKLLTQNKIRATRSLNHTSSFSTKKLFGISLNRMRGTTFFVLVYHIIKCDLHLEILLLQTFYQYKNWKGGLN